MRLEIGLYRQWFREAVDHSRRWQEQAREDYDFVEGRQWRKEEIKRFEETGRPALVINRIKPLVNLLSGWQRLNRYDIEFAARTNDDTEIAQVRKGITKYVLDTELQEVYPEHADKIEGQYAVYDSAESEAVPRSDELIWYKRELQKIRVVECWYKKREKQTLYMLSTGDEIKQSELTPEMLFQGLIIGIREITIPTVKVSVFFDNVLLEEKDSPYEHGEFPLVPLTCYYYGIGGEEIPAGFVRDLKDPQREINKRRIQQLHILNTTGNGGGFVEEDAMDAKQFAEFEAKGNIPGHFQRVKPMTLSQGKIQERQIGQYPAGLAQAEMQATNDLTAISGINEALMGVDVPHAASGRAIELKQKQAVTHLAAIFDNLRAAKRKVAELLWGKRNRAGVIPQFYTEDKVYRIDGVNGQQFIRVNQQVIEQDPLAGAVVRTLNDLSQGEFDIVISDVEASTTQRQAQMYALIDAVSRLGISGDIVFDIILDLSDIPNKEEIKVRWQQRQESQAKAAQNEMEQQLRLEEIKNQDSRQVITFKDAPFAIQMAMAAKAGLIDPQIAKYAVDQMMRQLFPDMSFQQPENLTQESAGYAPEDSEQAQALMQSKTENKGNFNKPMTQAALESLMRGMTPAI